MRFWQLEFLCDTLKLEESYLQFSLFWQNNEFMNLGKDAFI